MQEPLLKYRLPAVACPPPLVLQVTPLLSSQSGSPQKGVLFVVQYHVNPQLRGVLRSATFTLQCPRILGEPKKVSFSSFTLPMSCSSGFTRFLTGLIRNNVQVS